jgi:predicted transport protein
MSMSVFLNGESFERVTYSSEQDFERLVAENAQALFGGAIYIDAKRKMGTSSLGGTIPDGFLIDLSEPDDPQFYLVEVELRSHDFFSHIFPQITKFFAFYTNAQQRHRLAETIFELSRTDTDVAKRIRNASSSAEVYKFLKDTIDNSQNILIIIDGPKAEFEEIVRTYTDTWGKMVKVQIVSHFRRGEDSILTIEPPFGTLSFADAISAPPEEGSSQEVSYTEQFHLDNCSAHVNDVYQRLKNEFLTIRRSLSFNPTKSYIGVSDTKNIAFILLRKKRVRLTILLAEDETRSILRSGHHRVVSHSQAQQRAWAGNNPNCSVIIDDTNNWDEIHDLLTRIVEKNQEG